MRGRALRSPRHGALAEESGDGPHCSAAAAADLHRGLRNGGQGLAWGSGGDGEVDLEVRVVEDGVDKGFGVEERDAAEVVDDVDRV